MSDHVAELVRRGKQLPPAERERLVEELLESLNAEPGLDPSWEPEIARRLAEYDTGKVQAIDADDVFARARRAAEE